MQIGNGRYQYAFQPASQHVAPNNVATNNNDSDRNAGTAATRHHSLTRPGGECVLCGDADTDTPCNELDLPLGVTNTCPDTHPYCMNEIRVDYQGASPPTNFWFPDFSTTSDGLEINQFGRCVDELTADNLWYQETRTVPECENPASVTASSSGSFLDNSQVIDFSSDGANQQVGVTCHFACYGDGCNIDSIPDASTLYKP